MAETGNQISIKLSDYDREAVDLLREEMGLEDGSQVIEMLVRQAAQRAAIVCPTCAHLARKTAEDEASCNSCLSVIHLTDGIWEVINRS
jgi:antitoxin component of RelBE/YafQ-DinJ toxin-antitoxin module